ncbi:MAG: hypothetical protein MRERV_20c021 [Mycoplasmataceae bacterium RV_VA103A]|nr:MAG: hypothetical protein MRERV_20c021 [Mycoplasmataceae bacterium RV_VA103A]
MDKGKFCSPQAFLILTLKLNLSLDLLLFLAL